MDPAALLGEAEALLPDAVELRRAIHREPELGLDLPRTQQRIVDALDGLPLDIAFGERCSSVIATLQGDHDGDTVLLRGDMDALPLRENTGLGYASSIDGAMHACGHDGHVAMLVAAARMLCDRKSSIAGTVRFMFQPGEEGHHGARVMIEEGILDPPPDLAFAIHASPIIPPGTLAGKAGPVMASADTFTITVKGRGGHASTPHLGSDPITTACEIVMGLQSMITREIDVFNPGVVTVGKLRAGTTNNVIPPDAVIHGTIRAVSARTRKRIKASLTRVAEGISAAHDQEALVEIEDGYPVTVNGPAATERAMELGDELVGEDHMIRMPAPTMGAEDWSYVLERVPGSMLFVGVKPDGIDNAPSAHSDRYLLEERGLATGIALYTAVALDVVGAGG
jgi:amidohydrolase